MASKAQEISAYEARVHWGRVLDEVGAGAEFVVSKRHKAVAALVPIEEWEATKSGGDKELVELIERWEKQHEATEASLDRAFSQLAGLRAYLRASRTKRQLEKGSRE